MEERLQKILSRAGLASRRQAEKWIQQGRVMVNGVVVKKLGTKADPCKDEIKVDGQPVRAATSSVYIMLHKPEGFVTTTKDPQGRPTVMELLKGVKRKVHPVGRLDYNSSGLLLFTSDGEITHLLTRPQWKIPKTYQAKVRGRISPEKIKALARGPRIGGPPLAPARVKFISPSRSGKHSWIEITITEGRSRQVRRMCEAVGHPVLKLKRVALGPLKLGNLPVGAFRYLTPQEVRALEELKRNARKTE